MAEPEPDEDAVVMGWLRGDDYEAALALRRRRPRLDRPHPAQSWLTDRLTRRRPDTEPDA